MSIETPGSLSEKLRNCLYPNLTSEEVARFRKYLNYLNAHFEEETVRSFIKDLEEKNTRLSKKYFRLSKEQLDSEFTFFSTKANSADFNEWYEEYTGRH